MIKLDKFFTYTPLKVFCFSLIISFILFGLLSFLSPPTEEQINSRHFFFTAGQIVLMVSIIFSLISSILLFLIFLNRYKTIRENRVLSFLTFYTPGVIFFLTILFSFVSNEYTSTKEYLYILLSIIPFFAPMTFYFIRFRRALKGGDIMEDFYILDEEEYGSYDKK